MSGKIMITRGSGMTQGEAAKLLGVTLEIGL